MAKKAPEKSFCDACGADIRGGSLYCYNCGGPVTEESKAAVAAKTATDGISDAWFREEITPPRDTTKLKPPAVTEVAEAPPIEKPGIYEEAKLKTAASLKRKGKTLTRKRVEVVWDEPDKGPDAKFILAALSLTLIVIVVFFVAAYLK